MAHLDASVVRGEGWGVSCRNAFGRFMDLSFQNLSESLTESVLAARGSLSDGAGGRSVLCKTRSRTKAEKMHATLLTCSTKPNKKRIDYKNLQSYNSQGGIRRSLSVQMRA